jgi:predicted amidohydrolase
MLRIAVAQFNATVGDLTGNVERIVECAAAARARGAQVLLTPELALCGYPPEDLLLRPDFYRACRGRWTIWQPRRRHRPDRRSSGRA